MTKEAHALCQKPLSELQKCDRECDTTKPSPTKPSPTKQKASSEEDEESKASGHSSKKVNRVLREIARVLSGTANVLAWAVRHCGDIKDRAIAQTLL